MKNNPIGYNDPTGHKEISDGDGNGTSCPTQDLVCQLAMSGYKKKNKEEIAKDLRLERPISGVHLGVSSQKGFIKDKGVYLQADFLMDWKMGNFYTMITVGAYDAIGTPTGGDVSGYGGLTTVHGIPLYGEEDISADLAGTNFDAAVSLGADALGKISGTKGLSIDVDDSLKPIHTGAGL